MLVDMAIIAQLESSAGKDRCAYTVAAHDIGLYQITRITLAEYNHHHDIKYSVEDLLDKNINFKVAFWYMNVRIPQYIRHYHLQDSLDHRLVAWNGGIGALLRGGNKNTRHYVWKYHKAVGE